MSITSRSKGIPSGRGGGSGGAVAVNNTDCDIANEVSPQAARIVVGDGLGFMAYTDADDPSCVILGVPPNFLPPFPLGVTDRANTDVRVGEPVANFLAGLNENWVGTTKKATQLGNISWQSGQCTGFGGTSSMRIQVTGIDLGANYFDHTFPSAGDSQQTEGRVNFRVANTAPDGDGSRNAATVRMEIGLAGLLLDAGNGHTSGSFRVTFTHTDFDFTIRTFTEEFFLDDVANPAVTITNDIQGGLAFSMIEPVDYQVNTVLKHISGISYFTTGSQWEVATGVIHEHNRDSSRPTESLLIETHGTGVADYNVSPWTHDQDFIFVETATKDRFDNDMLYSPDESRVAINRANFRHIGDSTASIRVRDSWQMSSPFNSSTVTTCVDTFLDDSTNLIETFNGESRRLQGDYTTAWDSTRFLVNGEAAVFGGALMRPTSIFDIDENVDGAIGSSNNLSTYTPSLDATNNARVQPDYSGLTNSAVFFREFLAANPTTSYSNMTFNIVTRNGVAFDLNSGDLKIYLWKLGSSAPTSPNLTIPPAFDPANPELSKVNSIWVHDTYNFASFDDGTTQSAATSGCQVNIVGNTITCTFGGANVERGVLVRFEISNNVIIDQVTASF